MVGGFRARVGHQGKDPRQGKGQGSRVRVGERKRGRHEEKRKR